MLLHLKPIWAELYNLFLEVCGRAICQASDRSARPSENSYSIQSVFCARHELLTEENCTTQQLHFNCRVLDGISNVYYSDNKPSIVWCTNTLTPALSHHSEENQGKALEEVTVCPLHTGAIHQAKTYKVTCKILKNISKDLQEQRSKNIKDLYSLVLNTHAAGIYSARLCEETPLGTSIG